MNNTSFQRSLQMLCYYHFKFQIQLFIHLPENYQLFVKFRFKLVDHPINSPKWDRIMYRLKRQNPIKSVIGDNQHCPHVAQEPFWYIFGECASPKTSINHNIHTFPNSFKALLHCTSRPRNPQVIRYCSFNPVFLPNYFEMIRELTS